MRPLFAALGHQDSWERITDIVRLLRVPPAEPLTDVQLREIVPWIPPRTVSRIQVNGRDGSRLPGIYIDTFITPDELAGTPTRRMLAKVRDGIDAARREGAPLLALGGYTSILLESAANGLPSDVILTTGNSLTAALIVRGIERAARLLRRPLAGEELLIIGATGDIGSACARYFSARVRRLVLVARDPRRLQRVAAELGGMSPIEISTDTAAWLSRASLVIAAASTVRPSFQIDGCSPEAVICDAGYPKNIETARTTERRARLFHGGMGVIERGYSSEDGMLEQFYRFPVPHVAHGCMLEGIVLALSGRLEPFSAGRGYITPERIEEIGALAEDCGIRLAPLFNADGLWPEELTQ